MRLLIINFKNARVQHIEEHLSAKQACLSKLIINFQAVTYNTRYLGKEIYFRLTQIKNLFLEKSRAEFSNRVSKTTYFVSLKVS